uniref:Uncharacterized protein n=1 Tax=Timema bartmani TaxID=61472 RepID=A0A7R9I3S8_9NEOP|nr:unnamed protein product [Timema bartmani]
MPPSKKVQGAVKRPTLVKKGKKDAIKRDKVKIRDNESTTLLKKKHLANDVPKSNLKTEKIGVPAIAPKCTPSKASKKEFYVEQVDINLSNNRSHNTRSQKSFDKPTKKRNSSVDITSKKKKRKLERTTPHSYEQYDNESVLSEMSHATMFAHECETSPIQNSSELFCFEEDQAQLTQFNINTSSPLKIEIPSDYSPLVFSANISKNLSSPSSSDIKASPSKPRQRSRFIRNNSQSSDRSSESTGRTRKFFPRISKELSTSKESLVSKDKEIGDSLQRRSRRHLSESSSDSRISMSRDIDEVESVSKMSSEAQVDSKKVVTHSHDVIKDKEIGDSPQRRLKRHLSESSSDRISMSRDIDEFESVSKMSSEAQVDSKKVVTHNHDVIEDKEIGDSLQRRLKRNLSESSSDSRISMSRDIDEFESVSKMSSKAQVDSKKIVTHSHDVTEDKEISNSLRRRLRRNLSESSSDSRISMSRDIDEVESLSKISSQVSPTKQKITHKLNFPYQQINFNVAEVKHLDLNQIALCDTPESISNNSSTTSKINTPSILEDDEEKNFCHETETNSYKSLHLVSTYDSDQVNTTIPAQKQTVMLKALQTPASKNAVGETPSIVCEDISLKLSKSAEALGSDQATSKQNLVQVEGHKVAISDDKTPVTIKSSPQCTSSLDCNSRATAPTSNKRFRLKRNFSSNLSKSNTVQTSSDMYPIEQEKLCFQKTTEKLIPSVQLSPSTPTSMSDPAVSGHLRDEDNESDEDLDAISLFAETDIGFEQRPAEVRPKNIHPDNPFAKSDSDSDISNNSDNESRPLELPVPEFMHYLNKEKESHQTVTNIPLNDKVDSNVDFPRWRNDNYQECDQSSGNENDGSECSIEVPFREELDSHNTSSLTAEDRFDTYDDAHSMAEEREFETENENKYFAEEEDNLEDLRYNGTANNDSPNLPDKAAEQHCETNIAHYMSGYFMQHGITEDVTPMGYHSPSQHTKYNSLHLTWSSVKALIWATDLKGTVDVVTKYINVCNTLSTPDKEFIVDVYKYFIELNPAIKNCEDISVRKFASVLQKNGLTHFANNLKIIAPKAFGLKPSEHKPGPSFTATIKKCDESQQNSSGSMSGLMEMGPHLPQERRSNVLLPPAKVPIPPKRLNNTPRFSAESINNTFVKPDSQVPNTFSDTDLRNRLQISHNSSASSQECSPQEKLTSVCAELSTQHNNRNMNMKRVTRRGEQPSPLDSISDQIDHSLHSQNITRVPKLTNSNPHNVHLSNANISSNSTFQERSSDDLDYADTMSSYVHNNEERFDEPLSYTDNINKPFYSISSTKHPIGNTTFGPKLFFPPGIPAGLNKRDSGGKYWEDEGYSTHASSLPLPDSSRETFQDMAQLSNFSTQRPFEFQGKYGPNFQCPQRPQLPPQLLSNKPPQGPKLHNRVRRRRQSQTQWHPIHEPPNSNCGPVNEDECRRVFEQEWNLTLKNLKGGNYRSVNARLNNWKNRAERNEFCARVYQELIRNGESAAPNFRRLVESAEVKEGFGNQINLCWDQGLNPGPPAQKSDTLPLDHQIMYNLYAEKVENPASRQIYEREFHAVIPSFKKPQVDTCHKCDILNMKLKIATTSVSDSVISLRNNYDLKVMMSSIGMLLLLDLCSKSIWETAYQIHFVMKKYCIDPLMSQTEHDATTSQAQKIFCCIEVCMNSNHGKDAVDILAAYKLQNPYPNQWQLASNPADVDTRNLLVATLLEGLVESNYVKEARKLFDLLYTAQKSVKKPIDIAKHLNTLLVFLLDANLNVEALNLFLKIDQPALPVEVVTYRALLAACVEKHMMKAAETLWRSLVSWREGGKPTFTKPYLVQLFKMVTNCTTVHIPFLTVG